MSVKLTLPEEYRDKLERLRRRRQLRSLSEAARAAIDSFS